MVKPKRTKDGEGEDDAEVAIKVQLHLVAPDIQHTCGKSTVEWQAPRPRNGKTLIRVVGKLTEQKG